MRITLKLFAYLADFLPSGSRNNRTELDASESDTVVDIIERFRLPEKEVHLVLVNGVYLASSDRATRILIEGDHLAIWPPVH